MPLDDVPDGLARLRERLAREQRLIVAFSGGADSALLAWVADDVLGRRALAVTAVSPSLPSAERTVARRFAREHGIAHLEVCTDEFDRPEYRRNTGNRCFHCKTAMFDAVAPMADLLGARVALGTNVDDLGDHRPGQRAAALRGAVAPLVDARLTKADVRRISADLGLATADKPAAACLSSRVAYGDAVTPELVGRIEAAESAIRALGFPTLRVRAHGGGTLARIEVPAADLGAVLAHRTTVVAAVADAGFVFVTLDLAGFRSGSLNALLPRQRPSLPVQPA